MAALADAALDEQERELLRRFVAALRAEYGDDLDAVGDRLVLHARRRPRQDRALRRRGGSAAGG
jgi:hypothetical protein